nr:hypothetical protein [Bacillus subtilis]
MSGWLAHILEQYDNNRLIRPRADYTGPDKQNSFRLKKEPKEPLEVGLRQ